MVKKINSNEDTLERILTLFLDGPTRKIHVRETAALIGIAPRTAKKYLEILRERGLLVQKKDKLYDSYSANRESGFFRDLKLFHNVKMIKDSGLAEFLEKELNYPAIILYGSASRGEDVENSDIDIFVVAKKCEDVDVTAFEKRLRRGIHIMCMNEKEFRSGRSKELINNVINGFVLSGFLEIFE